MKISIKKLIVLFIFLTFLLPIIPVSSSENLNSLNLSEKINLKDAPCTKKCCTIYRLGPDGSVKPIIVNIDINRGEDIGESIANKCEELFEKDAEMQNLLKLELENLTFGFICKIKSHGRGFHYKSLFLEKIVTRFVFFRLGLPRLTTVFHKTLVVCRYPKDINAKTKITQIFGKNNTSKTVIIKGNQTVIAQNFIGYTTWLGRFSKSFLDLIPRAFAGFARFVVCNKLS